MNNNSQSILLFYPVSPVHMRNLDLLADKLPEWIIRVIYNPKLAWFTPERMGQYPYECLPFVNDYPSEATWRGNVRAVIMSTAQVRRPPFNLVKAALVRGIPTVEIEEVYQLALSGKAINNYMLPVDELLVASEYERNGFIEAGVSPAHVHVTGWPFYSGLVEPASTERKAMLRQRFGLDEERPVATLTLTMSSLADSISREGPAVRRELLSLVAQGLPPEYQFLVKAHPAEDPSTVIPFVEQYAPRAQLVERYTGIQDVLDVTDVLFNQGVSQVVIEALLSQLPVVVIPVGIKTIFDDILSDLIIREPEDVPKALSILGDNPMAAYKPIFQTHLSIPPQQALELTARRITEIAEAGQVRDPIEKLPELVLWQACLIDRNETPDTLALLRQMGVNSSLCLPIERLVQEKASRQDVAELLDWAGPALRSYAIKTLWIDTLRKRNLLIQQEDLDWLSDFPPRMMGPLFMRYAFQWGYHLLKFGHKRAAEELVGRLAEEFGYMDSVRNYVAKFPMLVGRADLAAHRLTPAALSFAAGRLRHYVAHPRAAARRLYRALDRFAE